MAQRLKKQTLARLEDIVGKERVFDDPTGLVKYLDLPVGSSPGTVQCIIKPASREQVQEIVKAAREEDINIVPVSSGPPHIYGGTTPSTDGVIVDMTDLNKVIRVDRRNKVAIIEPGVTFGKLREAVKPEGLRILMPLLPRANKSVLSSYLEREPILVPKNHWDMTDPMLCTEVVFGTGDIFRTGSAAGPGTLEEQWSSGAAQINPMGPGQTDFVRLLQAAQGSMGIVTWASIKLGLTPSIRRVFFIPHQSLERIIDFAYATLRLRIGEEFLILNAFSLASMLGKEEKQIQAISDRQATWTATICLAGYEYFPEDRLRSQEMEIKRIALHLGLEVWDEIPDVGAEEMASVLDNPCKGPLWKSRYRGASRDIFFITTLDRIPALLEVMRDRIPTYGFSPENLGIYIQPIQHGRNCHCEFILPCSSDDAEEVGRAEELFLDASSRLLEAGAFFSRPYGIWAEMAYARCPDTVKALRKVKGIVDPDGIMNRGRLCFQRG